GSTSAKATNSTRRGWRGGCSRPQRCPAGWVGKFGRPGIANAVRSCVDRHSRISIAWTDGHSRTCHRCVVVVGLLNLSTTTTAPVRVPLSAPSLLPFPSRIRSSHPFGKRPPVLARPLERWRHVVHGLTALAEVRQLLRRLGRVAVVPYAWPFLGFVRAAGQEELDP